MLFISLEFIIQKKIGCLLPTYSFVKDNFSNMNLLMLISWEGIRIYVACYACGRWG